MEAFGGEVGATRERQTQREIVHVREEKGRKMAFLFLENQTDGKTMMVEAK